MFKFIHAADIHLDSPLLNLDQYDGAPLDTLRVATRDAFDNLIQLAIEEQVRFLLIAGDLYDKDSPNFHTPIHVRRQMEELARHGIAVFIVQGNHDATSEAKRAFALSMPENVHVFSTRKPETKTLEDVQAAVHGQGFPGKKVFDDLSANYPTALPGYYNIGLLHTNLGGNATHDNYAPSTTDGLRQKQYQYWALGHIHKRNTSIGPQPHIIYPGNTQGRHIRESGPKGCVLVTVSDDLRSSVSFRATDVWRWQQCKVDASQCPHPDDVIAAACGEIDRALRNAEERALAVRVRVHGQSLAHRQLLNYAEQWRDQLRLLALDHFEERVWIEKFEVRSKQPQAGSAEQSDAAWGELIAGIQAVIPDFDQLADVQTDLREVLRSLPHDGRLHSELLDLDDEETVKLLVSDAKELLVAKLLDAGASK